MPRLYICSRREDREAGLALRHWLVEQAGWRRDDIAVHGDVGARCETAQAIALLLSPGALPLAPDAQRALRCARGRVVTVALDGLDPSDERLSGLVARGSHAREIPILDQAPTEPLDYVGPDGETGSAPLNRTQLKRLAALLDTLGASTHGFEWKPARAGPYPGLSALEEGEEAIFHGRDDEIRDAIGALERMNDGSAARAMIVHGPCGAGKSSLLGAGLWRRLRAHSGFTPLGVARASRGILSVESWGLVSALEKPAADLLGMDRARLARRVAGDLMALLGEIADADADEAGRRRTLLLGIERAEEIVDLEPEADAEFDRLMALVLSASADLDLRLAFTARDEKVEAVRARLLQAGLGPEALVEHRLAHLTRNGVLEMIHGPAAAARRAGYPLEIKPELAEALVQALEDSVELRGEAPLMALALRRLIAKRRMQNGRITLHPHQAGAFVGDAVARSVEEAMTNSGADEETLIRLVASKLIDHGLAPGADDHARRRLCFDADLSEQQRGLIEALLQKGLVTRREFATGAAYELIHDCLLRAQPIRGIAAQRRRRRDAARALEREARDWTEQGRGDAWLLHSDERLSAAQALFADADSARELARSEPEIRAYLAACAKAQGAEQARRDDRLETDLAAARELAQEASTREQALRGKLAAAEERAAAAWELENAAGRRSARMRAGALAAGVLAAVLAVLGGVSYLTQQDEIDALGVRLATAERTVAVAAGGRVQNAEADMALERARAEARTALARVEDAEAGQAAAEARAAEAQDEVVRLNIVVDQSERRIDRLTEEADALRAEAQAAVANANAAWAEAERALADMSSASEAGVDARNEITRLNGLIDEARAQTRQDKEQADQQIAALRLELEQAAEAERSARSETEAATEARRRADADAAAATTAMEAAQAEAAMAAVVAVEAKSEARRAVEAAEAARAELDRAMAAQQTADQSARRADVARRDALVAERGFLAEAAQAMLGQGDVGNAMVLARRALPQDLSAGDLSAPPGAAQALFDTLATPRRDASTFAVGDAAVRQADFSADGARLLTRSEDGSATVWDAASGARLARLDGHDGGLVSASFGGDGETVLTAGREGGLRLWRAASGAVDWSWEAAAGGLLGARFSADNAHAVSWSADGVVRLHGIGGDRPAVTLDGHGGVVSGAALGADGAYLLTWSSALDGGDGTARLWDSETGEAGAVFGGTAHRVIGAAYLANGEQVLSWGAGGEARLWSAANGALLATFDGHDGPMLGAEPSRDGARILSWGDDGAARLWRTEDGAEVATLGHENGAVRGGAINPAADRDPRWGVATWGEDGALRFWDADTGAAGPVARIDAAGAAFSADGARLIVWRRDGGVQVWPAKLDAAAAEADRILGALAPMPPDERCRYFDNPAGACTHLITAERYERVAEQATTILTEQTKKFCGILADSMAKSAREQVQIWLQFYTRNALLTDVAALAPRDPGYYRGLAETYERQRETLQAQADEYMTRYVEAATLIGQQGERCLAEGFDFVQDGSPGGATSLVSVRGVDGEFSSQEAIELALRHAREARDGAPREAAWIREFKREGGRLAGVDAALTEQ